MKGHLRYCSVVSVLLLIFTITFCEVFGQVGLSSCDEAIKEAYHQYESGDFYACIGLIEPCLENVDRNTKYEAYRLLALCYQQLKDEEMLHKAVLGLLKTNPTYKDFPMFDPAEFSRLLDEYEVWPELELGFRLGMKANSVRTIRNYSVSSGAEARYIPKPGYLAGINAEFFIRKSTSLNLDLLLESFSYTKQSDDVYGWKQKFTENLSYYSFPLYVRQQVFMKKGWKLSCDIGVNPFILNRASSSVILTNNESEQRIQNSSNKKDQRSPVLFSAIAGIAMKRQVSGGTFVLGIRYSYGFSNVVNEDKRYDDIGFIMENQYIDSDFAFTPIYLNLGYQYPLKGRYVVRKKG